MFLSSLLSTTYAVEKFEPIALWLTIGVLFATILVGALLFFLKRSVFTKYLKTAIFGVVSYLLCLCIVFFALDIAKNYSDDYAEENWLDKQALVRFILLPLLVFTSLSLLSLTAFAILSVYKPAAKKTVGLVCGLVCGATLIAVLVCIGVYYNQKIANDGYYNSDEASVEQIALYLSALVTVVAVLTLAFSDRQKLSFDSRSLAYAGICTAMSFALSYIKLWDMPQGGSVTLVSLLPLMLYSYLFGTKKGVFVGLIYGTLQAIQDPWLIHPAQFLLDYPIAFSAVGLAGLLHNVKALRFPQLSFALGGICAGSFRFLCHVLSGVFAFSVSAEGQNVWVFSLVYNSYVFIDVALVIVAGAFVLSSKSFVAAVLKTSKAKRTTTDTKETEKN
ncbi:MAG: hypothetical protein E7380_04010 [Clostridiales bacterium]|nr:hypothetical protein [Clostridiales bacterium]